MKRILLLLSAVGPLALASCGPDCDAYCQKLAGCGEIADTGQCVDGCDNVGGDHMAQIDCVNDSGTTCQNLHGRCVVPSP